MDQIQSARPPLDRDSNPELGHLPSIKLSRPGILAPLLMSLMHGLLWLLFFAFLLLVVPNAKVTFADFQVQLPWSTSFMIALSDSLMKYWYGLPFVVCVCLAVDLWLLYFLRRGSNTRILGWLWFIALLVLPLGLLAWAWLAIWQPYMALIEGLAN